MNPMLTFKHWKDEHHLHMPDMHEIKLTSEKLVHNPLFWLAVALIGFLALMIILGYFANPTPQTQFPMNPYGTGYYPIYP